MICKSFHVDPALLIAGPLLILIVPFKWTTGFLIASFLHETAHILCVTFLNGKIYNLRLGLSGAVINASVDHTLSAIISTLAGPVTSCSLFLFYDWFPELAFCGIFQGIVNLIPVHPLDGGRILHLILNAYFPRYSEKILALVRCSVIVCVFLLVVCAMVLKSQGFLCYMILILFSLLRKTPCKPD